VDGSIHNGIKEENGNIMNRGNVLNLGKYHQYVSLLMRITNANSYLVR